MRTRIPSSVLKLIAILVGLPGGLRAEVKIWDGSANGLWSTNANWTDGTAPMAGDDLVFSGTGVTRLNVTNDFNPPRAFKSITFVGSNYVVFGANLALSNGISAEQPVGTNTIRCPLELRANQVFECVSSAASALLNIAGNLVLGTHTLTVTNVGRVYIGGVISGAGGVTKEGAGTLQLYGSSANTYTGLTHANGGDLELNKNAGTVAIPGNLLVGNMAGGSLDFVVLLANDQIANTRTVTVQESGRLDLNDHGDIIGLLSIIGGSVRTGGGIGTGILTLNGNGVHATSTANRNASIFGGGRLSMGSLSRYFTVTNGPRTPDLSIQPSVVGMGGILKNGTGSLELQSSNAFIGETTISQGELVVGHSFALGLTNNGTVLQGGNLRLEGPFSPASLRNLQVPLESLSIMNPATVFLERGRNSWAGNVIMNSDLTVDTIPSGQFDRLTITGRISGSGRLTKTGRGYLVLAGSTPNTYTNETTVLQGHLRLGKTGIAVPGDLVVDGTFTIDGYGTVVLEGPNQIANMARVSLGDASILQLEDHDLAIGSLAGSGEVYLGTGTLVYEPRLWRSGGAPLIRAHRCPSVVNLRFPRSKFSQNRSKLRRAFWAGKGCAGE